MDLKSLSSAYSALGNYAQLKPVQRFNSDSRDVENIGAKVAKGKDPTALPVKDTVRISQRAQALVNRTSGDEEKNGVEEKNGAQATNTQNTTTTTDTVRISQKVQTLASQALGVEPSGEVGLTNGVGKKNEESQKSGATQKSDSYESNSDLPENTNRSRVEYDQPIRRLPPNFYV